MWDYSPNDKIQFFKQKLITASTTEEYSIERTLQKLRGKQKEIAEEIEERENFLNCGE